MTKNSEELKNLNFVSKEINKIIYMLNNISSISKITVNKKYLKLDLIIDTFISDIKKLVTANNVIINKNIDKNIYGNFDEASINQVLLNIIKIV